MPDYTPEELAALVAACDNDLGDPDLWFEPDGYRGSLALCVIDSIFSTGAHYNSVVNVVRRYRQHRGDQGGDADTDGVRELLATLDELGGPEQWAEHFQNRRRTSTHTGAPLKAEAIKQAAEGLAELGVWNTADLKKRFDGDTLEDVKRMWRSVPGQRSGVTWAYFLMLAGIRPYPDDAPQDTGPKPAPPDGRGAVIRGVKPDRMIIRYVMWFSWITVSQRWSGPITEHEPHCR